MKEFNLYMWIALVALIVGGVNWGLFGLVKIDLISSIFGEILGRLIFIGVGAAAGYFCYLIYLEKFKKS